MNHIELAHYFWGLVLKPGDTAVDATCGNGKDTLQLARLVGPDGLVVGLDIQQQALEKSRALLEKVGMGNVRFFLQSHEEFPPLIEEKKVKLIVYNLGYLPGGDKRVTTQCSSTLISLKKSLSILAPQGCISVTCYPGHPEGAKEEKLLLDFIPTLDPLQWEVFSYRALTRPTSPSLLLIHSK